MSQPKWTFDEVLLAVNTYFELGEVKNITSDNPLVIQLSSSLRKLPIHINKSSIFRNINGARMILFNIASVDSNSDYHLGKATKLQKYIYNVYVNDKTYLKTIAEAMQACLPLPFDYYNPLNVKLFDAGIILYLYHLYIENKSNAAIIAKKNCADRKKSKCEICNIDCNCSALKFFLNEHQNTR